MYLHIAQANALPPSNVDDLLADAEEVMLAVDVGPICPFPLSSLWTARRVIGIKF